MSDFVSPSRFKVEQAFIPCMKIPTGLDLSLLVES